MTPLKRILLVEDSPRDAELILDALGGHQLANEVVHVRDGADALDYLYRRGMFADRSDGQPAMILLDLKLPKVDGLEVLRQIKGDAALKMIPVVMMTSSREEQDLLHSYQLGVNAYVVKPMKFQDFVEAVRQVGAFWGVINEVPPGSVQSHKGWFLVAVRDSNQNMPGPLRVLHLEDSPRDAEVIRHQLEEGGLSCDVLLVDSKDSFEAALTQEPFDLILCDYNLPGYDGISALKYAQQARPDVPVIFISGTVGDEEAVKCLHLGATDYLLKDRLERLVSAVERAIQEAETRRARRLTEEKLQESEQLNRSLVEHLPQRIFVKDLNSRYVFCNSVYARDLGMEPTQIVGQDDFAFFSRERAEGTEPTTGRS